MAPTFKTPWAALADEVIALVAAEYTPMQALIAATRHGAEHLGRGHDLGTIEAGKLADLIAIDGDPLADPAHLKRVVWVMRDGAVVRDKR